MSLKHVDFESAFRHLAERRIEEAMEAAQSEDRICRLVSQINDLVRKLNTLGTNAINLGIAPTCERTEFQRMRERRAATRCM